MKRLPPIPTPPAQKWREFRIRVMPVLVFVIGLVMVVFFWRQNIGSPTLQGTVASVSTDIVSPQTGKLVELKVARFQKVSRGETVAIIHPSDPRAPLALLQAEMDLFRTRLEPRLSQQRNSTDYERLRLEWLLQKAELASSRVNLARSENELKRNEQLFHEKLISEALYDLSLKTRELMQTEVDEKSRLIDDLEKGLKQLAVLGDPQATSPTGDTLGAAVKAQEEKLQQAQSILEPIVLVAPFDGMVSLVYRQQGESVMNGDPIIAINALESNRIVGYLRQPFFVEPEVGMSVEVRKRELRSVAHLAEILHVGVQIEPITNSLATIRPGSIMDVGLPIEISLPPGLKARPGEMVDLMLRPVR
jgi:HlyD family secretion protein